MSLTGNELVAVDGVKVLHDYNEETYFKTDGSVPMEGVLWTGNGTDNGYGFVSSNKSLMKFGITNTPKDVTKNRFLEIDNSNYTPDISDALVLSDSDGTTTNTYKIYGEHNIDLLASTIQSLIDEGKITIN